MKICLCARYEGIGGLEVRIHSFFFFTLGGGNRLASCIDHCYSVKRTTAKIEEDSGLQNASENFEKKILLTSAYDSCFVHYVAQSLYRVSYTG